VVKLAPERKHLQSDQDVAYQAESALLRGGASLRRVLEAEDARSSKLRWPARLI